MHRSLLTASLALALCVPGIAAAAEDAESIVSLRWALGAREGENAAPTAIKRDTQLNTGARLKFLVEPLSAGSVYLIMLDSGNEISVLYRESGNGDKTYVPPGGWFELDDEAGLETFFLLASVEPLQALDRLLARHEAAEAAAKANLVTQIVAEIRGLHKAHRQFARPVEKPVMIGGQMRGEAEAGIDHLAVEISAERFYGKTISIDH